MRSCNLLSGKPGGYVNKARESEVPLLRVVKTNSVFVQFKLQLLYNLLVA